MSESATPAPLPVVFALHDAGGGYWLYAAVAMTSVLRHARGPVAIHILHDDTLTALGRRPLAEIAGEMGAPLTFWEQKLPAAIEPGRLGKFSPASLFRLVIPRLFPGEDLVIYLDCDLVANGLDIHELAAAAPPEAPISAVADIFVMRAESQRRNIERLGLDPARYFNSGVLALRPKLISGDLVEAFAGLLARTPDLLHPDQDFLNLRFGDEVAFLDERFNSIVTLYDSRLVQPMGFYANRILHYAGQMKPLSGVICPAFLPFFAHAMMTPEIYSGLAYEATTYLFPFEGRPDFTRGLRIHEDPRPPR